MSKIQSIKKLVNLPCHVVKNIQKPPIANQLKNYTQPLLPNFIQILSKHHFKPNSQLVKATLKPENFVARGKDAAFYRFPNDIKGYGLRVPINSVLAPIPKHLTYKPTSISQDLKSLNNIGVEIGIIGKNYQIMRWVSGKPAGNDYMDLWHAVAGQARGGFKKSVSREIMFNQLKSPISALWEKPTLSTIHHEFKNTLNCFKDYANGKNVSTFLKPERYESFIKVFEKFEQGIIKHLDKTAHKISQTAYDDALSTIKVLQQSGRKLDFRHPQNTMIDMVNQRFGFVDLPKNDSFHNVANATEFAKALLGGVQNNFIGKYLPAGESTSQAIKNTKHIIQKIKIAAEKHNVPFDEADVYKYCGLKLINA